MASTFRLGTARAAMPGRCLARIEKYLVPSRELLAVLQLWRASQQIVFRYDVIPGPKVFETQIHGKRFEMYNDTVLGFNKSGKEVARIQVEEPIYVRPAERVNWL